MCMVYAHVKHALLWAWMARLERTPGSGFPNADGLWWRSGGVTRRHASHEAPGLFLNKFRALWRRARIITRILLSF